MPESEAGLTEAQARAREIELREREVFLAEQRAREATRATGLDWLRGLALPIASLIVSGAVFLVQTQQMAFQDSWESAREGYKQYFEGVRGIKIEDEASYEEALGVFISATQAFPEVLCGVRQDFAVRIDRSPLPRAIVNARIAELRARAQPQPTYRAGLFRLLTPPPAPCGPIVLENEQAMNGVTAAALNRSYRVWVHVGPRRESLAPVDRLRERAGAQGFRVIANVEVDRVAAETAEVRYASEAEKEAAERLVTLLTPEFAAEGVQFAARPTPPSERMESLPANNLEVFVPDPAPPPPPPPSPEPPPRRRH